GGHRGRRRPGTLLCRRRAHRPRLQHPQHGDRPRLRRVRPFQDLQADPPEWSRRDRGCHRARRVGIGRTVRRRLLHPVALRRHRTDPAHSRVRRQGGRARADRHRRRGDQRTARRRGARVAAGPGARGEGGALGEGTGKVPMRVFVIGGVLVSLAFATIVSQFAVDNPDGLEWVAETEGFAEQGAEHAWSDFLFADYATRGIENETLSLAIAGIVGTLITLLVAWGILRAFRERSPGATA